MDGRESRRRMTLSDQLSVLDSSPSPSSNLRDLLKVREEEDLSHSCRRGGGSVTLGTVLACDKRDLSSSHGFTAAAAAVARTATGSTLLDIIRDEEEAGGGAFDRSIIGNSNDGHKTNWRAFKDRLRLRRAGTGHLPDDISAADLTLPPAAAPASSSLSGIPVPETGATGASVVAEYNPSSSAAAVAGTPPPQQPATTVETATTDPSSSAVEASDPGTTTLAASEVQQQQQQIRVSLMALLEQTDRQVGGGFGVSTAVMVEEEEDDDDEDGVAGAGNGNGGNEMTKMYRVCCVCMVRHKGAAFIPCGHTFCRLCSRELWVSRGNCPLCNGYILEILDIF